MSGREIVKMEPDPVRDIVAGSMKRILSPDLIKKLIDYLKLQLEALTPSSNDKTPTNSQETPPGETEEIVLKLKAMMNQKDLAVRKFLRKHETWKEKRQKLILELQGIVMKVDEVHQYAGKHKVVGHAITFTGTLMAIGGVYLLSSTGRSSKLSAGLIVGGALGAVGGMAYKYTVASYEYGLSDSKCNEVSALLKKDEKTSDELNECMKEACDTISHLRVEFNASKELFKLLKEAEDAGVSLFNSFCMMLNLFSALEASSSLHAGDILQTYELVISECIRHIMALLKNINSIYEESGVSNEIKQAISTLQGQVDKMNEIVTAINDSDEIVCLSPTESLVCHESQPLSVPYV